MDEMAEHLAMNERFQTLEAQEELPVLMHATDVGLTPQGLDPIKARREILSRGHYLKNIKGVYSAIKSVSKSPFDVGVL